MTISSTTRKAGPFSGNNVTVAFPFAFKVFDETDLVVVATDADDLEATQTLTTHYTVSLNADQDASPGGTVTMLAAPASGTLLTITSDVPELQAVALTNNGGFYPAVINGALDRLTILIQQVAEEAERAVKVPISSSTDPDDLVASVTADAAAAAASAAAAAGSAAAAAAAIPVGSLGYTPVDEAGHTMTGELVLPSIKLGASASYSAFGNVVTKTHGTASGNVPLVGTTSATETLAGLVELANQAEAEAGSVDNVVMTPLKTAQAITAKLNATGTAPIYACRAWVNFNGTGIVAIRESGNVSSITDNATGDYTVNFTAAMPDANYAESLTPIDSAGSGPWGIKGSTTKTTTALRFVTASASTGTATDLNTISVAIFR